MQFITQYISIQVNSMGMLKTMVRFHHCETRDGGNQRVLFLINQDVRRGKVKYQLIKSSSSSGNNLFLNKFSTPKNIREEEKCETLSCI